MGTTLFSPVDIDDDCLSHTVSFLDPRDICDNVLSLSKTWNGRVTKLSTYPRIETLRDLSFIWKVYLQRTSSLQLTGHSIHSRDVTLSKLNRVDVLIWLYKSIEYAKSWSITTLSFSEAVMAFEMMMMREERIDNVMDYASISFICRDSGVERNDSMDFISKVAGFSEEKIESLIRLNPIPPLNECPVSLQHYIKLLCIVAKVDTGMYWSFLDFLGNQALIILGSTVHPTSYPLVAFSVVVMFLFLFRLPIEELLNWEGYIHNPDQKWIINCFCMELSLPHDICEQAKQTLKHKLLTENWPLGTPTEIVTGTWSLETRNELRTFLIEKLRYDTSI